jgi:hypothetical protein
VWGGKYIVDTQLDFVRYLVLCGRGFGLNSVVDVATEMRGGGEIEPKDEILFFVKYPFVS